MCRDGTVLFSTSLGPASAINYSPGPIASNRMDQNRVRPRISVDELCQVGSSEANHFQDAQKHGRPASSQVLGLGYWQKLMEGVRSSQNQMLAEMMEEMTSAKVLQHQPFKQKRGFFIHLHQVYYHNTLPEGNTPNS
jgi:hypothetical protein